MVDVMRPILRTFVDVLLVLLATAIALLLRDNFATTLSRIDTLAPYVIGTALAAAVALPLSGLSQSIWRFSSPHDQVRVVFVVSAIVAGALITSFSVNRLETVPRSLPALQFLVCYLMLIGSRDLIRSYHRFRRTRATPAGQFVQLDQAQPTSVVVVGMTQLLEIYLRLLDHVGRDKVRVAAVLSRSNRHKGRVIREHRIQGGVDEIDNVLDELALRGVEVDRIIVLLEPSSLSESAQTSLRQIAEKGETSVEHITTDMLISERPLVKIAPRRTASMPLVAPPPEGVRFVVTTQQIIELSGRGYWPIKRALDVLLSSALIVVLSPFYVIAAVFAAMDVGRPMLFWQQRPGLAGRPLKVVKFRTMRSANGPDGKPLPDDKRTSAIGAFMRRSRLDELPQLFSILTGAMSFVGPRPLLPRDQLGSADARLLVRPGLTGWAQVSGGRIIQPDDKMALDIWYVCNASLWLDIWILFQTATMLIGREAIDDRRVAEAWQYLIRHKMVEGKLLRAAE